MRVKLWYVLSNPVSLNAVSIRLEPKRLYQYSYRFCGVPQYHQVIIRDHDEISDGSLRDNEYVYMTALMPIDRLFAKRNT